MTTEIAVGNVVIAARTGKRDCLRGSSEDRRSRRRLRQPSLWDERVDGPRPHRTSNPREALNELGARPGSCVTGSKPPLVPGFPRDFCSFPVLCARGGAPVRRGTQAWGSKRRRKGTTVFSTIPA